MNNTLPPVGGPGQPTFIYHPTTPSDVEPTRFQVYVSNAPDIADAYVGTVYQTADGDWVADWSKRNDAFPIEMRGFATKEYAASALYWYAPPTQSVRSRPIGQRVPVSDERAIDPSQCGCCVNTGCECEGMNRISQRFGTTQTYQVQPSLIPEHGVLVSLEPINDGDFLVDLNTRGAGSGIGYLQQRDDGRYDVRVGHTSVGIAPSPEIGMWACFKEHTTTKIYNKIIKGFNHHPVQDAWVAGTITFRAETVEAAREAIDQAVEALVDGHERFDADSTTYDVTLKATQ
ncbi:MULTISPECIES: hypothetical protein [Streptomyces]|uniref:hypothetical protein n=1 Tax=Streptomyces TaxID=1883 RepID=UPI0004CD6D4E|nr:MULTISPECIES: hypothetical protein [Streptomyces]KOT51139.1 hypothetical protein ADK43_32610 [Streptomyces rimosus subsp. rimosus]